MDVRYSPLKANDGSIQRQKETQPLNRSLVQSNHTQSTIALCMAVLSVSYMLISVFPYSGYMVIQLMPPNSNVNEENVGFYAGMMASSFMIGRAMSSYGWGKASDVYGRVPCLSLSLLLSSLLSLGFGLSTTFWGALSWRFWLGIVNGVLPISKTSVSELANGDRTLETRGMGLVMGMWGWGFLISPAISGITAEPLKQYPSAMWLQRDKSIWYYKLLQKFPFLLPNLVGAMLGILALLAVFLFVPETLPKENVKSLNEIPNRLWSTLRRALSVIPEETSMQLTESASFASNMSIDECTPMLTEDRRKLYGNTRGDGCRDNDVDENDDDDIDVQQAKLLFPDLEEDVDDAITKAQVFHDEHSLLLSTTRNSRRAIAASFRHHSTMMSQRRRQSLLSSWKASIRLSTPVPQATISSLWSQRNTRYHMIVFWLSSFVSTTVDEGFPLFCISKAGGLGLSEKTIGKILSLCGLIFAISQYIVFTTLVTRFGLYGSIRISSTLMGPMVALIPFSLWINKTNTSTHFTGYDYINTPTFIFLSVVLATYRVCGLAFMSSLTVALNRTVLPSHRGAMNGLVALGGSVARAIGPIFSGALISFCLTSSVIPARIGAFMLFAVISILGSIVASLAYCLLRDDDEDDSIVAAGNDRKFQSKTAATAFTSTAIPHDVSKCGNPVFRTVRLFLQKQQELQRPRGAKYGASNNSTIPSARDAAAAVGVQPPASNVSARRWKLAYMIQKYMTPLLHIFDRDKPPNSSLNVYCMWWKALSGNDKLSPVYDSELSYDLLPRGTRQILKLFVKLFPRFHHANVEIRTAFLDQVITYCANEERSRRSKNVDINPVRIRLITFGAGYDIRSIKLKERGIIDEAIELDLPHVVDAKQKLLSSNRFQNRRPKTIQMHLPKQLYRVDLNNITHVQTILDDILSVQPINGERYYTIFVFEAILIYLNDGIPHSLLQVCSNSLRSNKVDGSLCFADRLENVPGGNYTMAVNEMKATGWNLVKWLPKPGLARHMGRATVL